MSFRTLCCSGLVAVLATSTALAGNYASSPAMARQTQMQAHRNLGGHVRLPRELKILWKHEERPRLKSLAKEQRHGWIRSQWAAMTPEQQNKKLAELQAHWNALPANVRQTILARHRERHQQHMAAREGQGQNERGHNGYARPGYNPQ